MDANYTSTIQSVQIIYEVIHIEESLHEEDILKSSY